MGKGKGNPEGWVSRVKPGRILFELAGVEEELLTDSFSVYPNPSSGRINILYSLNYPNSNMVLQIRDLRGKLMHKENLPIGVKEISLDLQDSPAGMYIVEMVSRSESMRKSFIIR